MSRCAPGRVALTAVPAVFLAVFFVYPLASIVGSVIADVEPGTVLGDARLRGVVWFTTWQAVVSTGLTLAAGLPAAYLLARFRFPGRGVLRVATLVAFVLPTVVVGAAFAGSRPSLASLFAAHVFFNLAVVVRVVGSFWSQLDPAYEDVAAEMGATGVRRFTDVLAAARATLDRGGGDARLPVHVHLVRRGAAARGAGASDDRGRDLPADVAAAEPSGGGGADARAARDRLGAAVAHLAHRVAGERASTRGRIGRRRPGAAHERRTGLRRRGGAAAGRRGARAALATGVALRANRDRSHAASDTSISEVCGGGARCRSRRSTR